MAGPVQRSMAAGPRSGYARVIATLCLFVVACIWTAGLWPFRTPDNAVTWRQADNGVYFGGHGAVVSESGFGSNSGVDTGSTLEVWLQPSGTKGAVLTFDSSSDPRSPFLLRQYGTGMAIQRYLVDDHGRVVQPWLKVENVFRTGKLVFLTITSDKNGVNVYINGALVKTSSGPGITSHELTGPLVLANSTGDDSWIGTIAGVAIYARQLDSSEVSQHFDTWKRGEGASLAADRSLTGLYVFSERKGSSIRNLVDSKTSLIIPAKYFVLHRTFLRSTWSQYRNIGYLWNRWSFWWDLAVNILGFAPVGFVFFAFFTSVRRIGHPVLVVVLLGFFLSFSVEALQWFLPNRDSGMTDLFTNTSGTALGVLLYRWSAVRMLWERILSFFVPSAAAHLEMPLPASKAPPIEQELIAG